MPAVLVFLARFAAKGPVSLGPAIALAVVVWLFGDRVALLRPWRLEAVIAIAVLWVLYAGWLGWSTWSRRRRMAAVLGASSAGAIPANPLEALDRQFASAAQAMEGTRMGRAAL